MGRLSPLRRAFLRLKFNKYYADIAWPIDLTPEGGPPQLGGRAPKAGREFMANPGDTLAQRKAKRAAWLASIKG